MSTIFEPLSLAAVLRKYMKIAGYGTRRLAQASGVAEPTIKNWRNGRVEHVREWQDLVRVAHVLTLDTAAVTELLTTAGLPSIEELINHVRDVGDRTLLTDWVMEQSSQQPTHGDVESGFVGQQFLELPLDAVPGVAPLPRGSRPVFSHNPLFVGRENELHVLAAALQSNATTLINQVEIAAATGLGGIGKTQLAIEFIHCYGQYFAGGVFWLSFADAHAIPSEVAICGRAGYLNLRPDFSQLPLDEQVQLVLAAWNSEVPRLLVFDNCEDERLLDQWRPKTGGCRILVTSRRATWNPILHVQTVSLDVLARNDSIALLRKHLPNLEDASYLEAIATQLGDLPLALHLAGSYLARYQHVVTPKYYLEQLCNPTLLEHPSLTNGGISPTGHQQHVARTFALSYDRLDPTNEIDNLAVKLLARIVRLAIGEPVPYKLLYSTVRTLEDTPTGILQAEDALARIVELGLAERANDGSLRLHRLVAAFVQAVFIDTTAQTDIEVALIKAGNQLYKNVNPGDFLAIRPHLYVVTVNARNRLDEQAASLCEVFGQCLRMIADYSEAEVYLAQALAIRERVLGSNHLDTSKSLGHIGFLHYVQAKYQSARLYLEQALAIQRDVLGRDHSVTATTLNDLAELFRALGEYDIARPIHEEALRIREQVLGTMHSDTASSLNNLGLLFYLQGKYKEAYELYERSLLIHEQVWGKDHPNTAEIINNIALLLYTQKDYEAARPLYERALLINENVLGPSHPSTAISLSNLAALLRDQGKYDEAYLLASRVLAIREEILGPMHPDTATALNNLAGVFNTQGNYAKARAFHERALRIRRKVLDPMHPYTAHSLKVLARVLKMQGEYPAARSMYEEALAIYLQLLTFGASVITR